MNQIRKLFYQRVSRNPTQITNWSSLIHGRVAVASSVVMQKFIKRLHYLGVRIWVLNGNITSISSCLFQFIHVDNMDTIMDSVTGILKFNCTKWWMESPACQETHNALLCCAAQHLTKLRCIWISKSERISNFMHGIFILWVQLSAITFEFKQ